jgi:His/Glu/Gln/Arg/opine family amino acid ABC transporter permease subunit
MPFEIIGEHADVYLEGLVLTIELTVFSLAGSLVLGLVVALLRISPVAPLRWSGAFYVEFFRNTPLLAQLFFWGFAAPSVGITFSEDPLTGFFRAATAGLITYHTAYVAEVIRGGLLSIERGQIEAGRSLGLSYFQMLRHIQIPQAVRMVVPPLGNIAIALSKNTSQASVLGVAELLRAGELVESRTFRATEAFGAVALLYLLLTIPLAGAVNYLERRLAVAR